MFSIVNVLSCKHASNFLSTSELFRATNQLTSPLISAYSLNQHKKVVNYHKSTAGTYISIHDNSMNCSDVGNSSSIGVPLRNLYQGKCMNVLTVWATHEILGLKTGGYYQPIVYIIRIRQKLPSSFRYLTFTSLGVSTSIASFKPTN